MALRTDGLQVLFTRHVETLKQAFSLVPDYLKTTDGEVNNYMDWGVQLGRQVSSIETLVYHSFIWRRGISSTVREHCRLAREFASWVDEDKDFERVAPVPFSVVCFRYHPAGIKDETRLDQLNARIIDHINATGEVFLSHTKLNGRYVLRLAIGNLGTTEKHITRVWELLKYEAAQLTNGE